MPAHKRISDSAVLEAIQTFRGKVEPAAERVGMTPNNLRKRLATLGVDLSLLRRLQGGGSNDPHPNRPLPMTPIDARNRPTPTAPKNASALYPRRAAATNLRDVQSEAAADAIPAASARVRPVRVIPAQAERLREAKFDLQAKHRVEFDESRILEQFFDERFEEWIKAKLAAKAKGDK